VATPGVLGTIETPPDIPDVGPSAMPVSLKSGNTTLNLASAGSPLNVSNLIVAVAVWPVSGRGTNSTAALMGLGIVGLTANGAEYTPTPQSVIAAARA